MHVSLGEECRFICGLFTAATIWQTSGLIRYAAIWSGHLSLCDDCLRWKLKKNKEIGWCWQAFYLLASILGYGVDFSRACCHRDPCFWLAWCLKRLAGTFTTMTRADKRERNFFDRMFHFDGWPWIGLNPIARRRPVCTLTTVMTMHCTGEELSGKFNMPFTLFWKSEAASMDR